MAFEDALEKQQSKSEPKETKLEQVYNDLVEESKRVSEATLTAFQKYWTQIFMAIMSFLLIGIQQFAEPKFDPYFFLRAQFWYDYIPFVMAQWLILFSKVTGDIKYLTETHYRSIDLQNDIQKHVDDDKKTPYIFEGAKLEDSERKARAFRRKISRLIEKKIDKYNFGTFSNFTAFCKGDLKYKEPKGYKKNSKREHKLRVRLNGLLYKLTDEYLKESLDSIKIKYNQVTETALKSGFSPKTDETYESDFKERTTSAIVNEFGAGQVMSMIFMFMVLALGLIPKEPTIVTIIFFAFKSFMLFWAYFKGGARSKVIFQRTTIKAMQERVDVLNRIKIKILS